MAPIYSDIKVHLRTDRSVTAFFSENVSNTDPNKVISEDTLTGKVATYGGLREDAFKAAGSLRLRHGVRRGDIVTIISRSCVDYIVAAHAIWAAGGIVSTINYANSVDEISAAIKTIKPKLLIADSAVHSKLDKAIKSSGQVYQTKDIISLISRTNAHSLFPEDLLKNATRIPPEAYILDGQDARKECAAIVLSSGTTGMPKAVMLSHYNLCAIAEGLRGHNPDNWRGIDREIFFPPCTTKTNKHWEGNELTLLVSHIYGLYVCALMGPWIGSYICLLHSFDMNTFCKLMQDKKATLARLVPTVAQALAMSDIVPRYTYPHLEYFSCAGAVLKPTTASSLRSKFPKVSLCQTYGCTELSSCVSQSGTRDAGAPLVATGTLLANIGIVFVDDQLNEVPRGQPGEICVSTPSMMMGYMNDEAATRESMLKDGWYRTGDIGYLDDKGYLIIVDRIKDVIKYKGFQVSPTELETLIGKHPLVQDVGVSSIWNESEATEVPRAYVKPIASVAPGAYESLAKDVERLVAEKAAGYKKLRGGVKFVDGLPRNPTGKLLRRLLRESEIEARPKI